MQNQWGGDSSAQGAYEAEVQARVARQHRVGGADRYGQRIHAGGRDVSGGFGGVGTGPGCVDAVLATDLAEFGLDPDSGVVAQPDHVGGGLDVVLIAESGGVEHHRAETQRDRFADQGLAGGVVEVHRGRHTGCPSGGQDSVPEGRQRTVVAGRVLADLQDDGSLCCLGAGDDRLGVFELDDVERGSTVTRPCGGRYYLCGAGERHGVLPRSVSAQLPEQLGAIVEEELEGVLVGVRSWERAGLLQRGGRPCESCP